VSGTAVDWCCEDWGCEHAEARISRPREINGFLIIFGFKYLSVWYIVIHNWRFLMVGDWKV